MTFGANPGGNPGGMPNRGPGDRERRARDFSNIDHIQVAGAAVVVALVLLALAIRLLIL